jgi:hypothetical protein
MASWLRGTARFAHHFLQQSGVDFGVQAYGVWLGGRRLGSGLLGEGSFWRCGWQEESQSQG